MIGVRLVEPDTKEWRTDRQKAAEAARLTIESMQRAEPITIDDKLYKRIGKFVYDAFHHKCAYCEAMVATTQPVDIDHFRPKKAVTDANGGKVFVDGANGQKHLHPGYSWLAYDWRNLLPACINCNRPRKNALGQTVGKGTRFPVQGFRAITPGDEAHEKPLFLHPVLDSLEGHFVFDPSTGVLGGKTPEGKMCVWLFDLNREGLPEARKDAYRTARFHARRVFEATDLGSAEEAISSLEVCNAYKEGRRAYALAGQAGLKAFKSQLLSLLNSLS